MYDLYQSSYSTKSYGGVNNRGSLGPRGLSQETRLQDYMQTLMQPYLAMQTQSQMDQRNADIEQSRRRKRDPYQYETQYKPEQLEGSIGGGSFNGRSFSGRSSFHSMR